MNLITVTSNDNMRQNWDDLSQTKRHHFKAIAQTILDFKMQINLKSFAIGNNIRFDERYFHRLNHFVGIGSAVVSSNSTMWEKFCIRTSIYFFLS